MTVTDETWSGLAAHSDHSQMLEILFTIGTFAMMSMDVQFDRPATRGAWAERADIVMTTPDRIDANGWSK